MHDISTTGSYKHGHQPSGSTKAGEFLDHLASIRITRRTLSDNVSHINNRYKKLLLVSETTLT